MTDNLLFFDFISNSRYTWMVQDEIQRVQKEEKQTEKRIKNIIFNNKKK